MDSVPDPFEARKCFLLSTQGHQHHHTSSLLPTPEATRPHLELEALGASQGRQDLRGHGGGQHEDLLRVGGVRMSFSPVEEHPPAQQSRHLVPGEHFPAAPGRTSTRQCPVPLSAPGCRSQGVTLLISLPRPSGRRRGLSPGRSERLPSRPEEEPVSAGRT